MDLSGKTALVTGAGRRVGRAIALALARAGADVAVHHFHSQAGAQEVVGEIERLGRRGVALRADLRDPAAIAELLAGVRSRFGRLDVLVNNAAAYDRTPLETLTAEQWDSQFTVNVRAAALCIRQALPLMGRDSCIVNIADVCVDRVWPSCPAYAASKAALLSLTQTAAKALAGRDIRVNSVAPGLAMWPEGFDEARKAEIVAGVPLGRSGTPEMVADAVLFLCRQDYITGENIRLDGGWHLG